MVRKLVINGSSLHITDHKGNTPLHIACSLGSAKCLDEILAFSSMSKVLEVTSIPNNEGLTCVHLAASHGCKDTLRKLKRIGTNMNSQVRWRAHYQHKNISLWFVHSLGDSLLTTPLCQSFVGFFIVVFPPPPPPFFFFCHRISIVARPHSTLLLRSKS